MKILYFYKNNKLVPGILTNEGIIDVCKASGYFSERATLTDIPFSTDEIQTLKKTIEQSANQPEFIIAESSLQIGPCVPKPSKIICIGLNYRKHAEESGMAIPTVPVVFTKYSNTLVNYGENVQLGKEGEQFDYEVELGVVIGKKCKNVPQAEALDHVFGYCTANDLSCRDLQFKTSQWLLGKSLDQFLPLGKYVVTADEVGDPQALQLSCSMNGEQRQNSNTADMIFSVAEIIAFLSRHMTLEPGDLILTGTPSGVIMGLPEKNWLKPGDKVKVEIEKLGYTENTMV
jgi:2-keto-4-pentenoate hydratase/2-oxohepta-3-ene-1,7-dioic acid hydratase in catechol pathway